ncbi:MAG TPA: hypothetical protein VGC79_03465 [Polyangiaceae bacterium]
MPPAWLNPAGGLRYHLRALAAGRDWQPFRVALARWLTRFEGPTAHAVLVGPSAGYTFPDAFLSRFSAITVLEPDPIAARLINRRLRRLGVATRVERADRLIAPLLSGADGLAELLRADPSACLIFGNVLGQTRFLVKDPDFDRMKRAFRERIVPLLAGRAWLSFHDRLSGAFAPSFQQPYAASSRLDDSAVLRELYPNAPKDLNVELFDHQSDGFFPTELAHSYFHWQIDGARHHLIEGVMGRSQSSSAALGLQGAGL